MLHVRQATEADSKDIFEWRNDELTRKMSHATDRVEWDGHCRWFASSIANDERLLLICETSGESEKVGFVRFDLNDKNALMSINLSPDMRGKGYAKQCLLDAIVYFKAQHPNSFSIVAEIKVQNLASRYTFEGVGFELAYVEGDVLHYRYSG